MKFCHFVFLNRLRKDFISSFNSSYVTNHKGLPKWLRGKNSASVRDSRIMGSVSGLEDPLEEETAIHSSTFAWRVPCIEEPGGLQSMGSQKSWTRLTEHIHTHPYIYVVYRYMHVGESIWWLYNKSNNSNTFTYFSRDQATYFIWELREFSNGTKQQYVQWWVHLINSEEKVEKFNSPCVQMYFQIYYEILGQTKIRRWRSGGKSIHFSTTITVLKKNL